MRSEFRYGSLHRTLAVPEDVNAEDVTATYKDGLLEIRVPMAAAPKTPSQKIPISKS